MDYLDKGHPITRAYYTDLLRQLWEKIKQIRHGKLTRGVFFHQKCGFQLVEGAPYSPDLAPSDYYLFPKIKKELSGYFFARDDDDTNAVDHFLRDQNGTFYTEGIHLLHDHWTKHVNVGGTMLKTYCIWFSTLGHRLINHPSYVGTRKIKQTWTTRCNKRLFKIYSCFCENLFKTFLLFDRLTFWIHNGKEWNVHTTWDMSWFNIYKNKKYIDVWYNFIYLYNSALNTFL